MNEKTRVLMFASLMIPDGSSSFLPLRQGLTDKVPILCFAVRLAQRAYSSKSRISHFLGTLADYEKKSSGGILWGTAYTWKEVEKLCDLPKELFTLMGVLGRSVRGLSAYPLGKRATRVRCSFLKSTIDRSPTGIFIIPEIKGFADHWQVWIFG